MGLMICGRLLNKLIYKAITIQSTRAIQKVTSSELLKKQAMKRKLITNKK
jgi:hypothetical protein